VRLAPLDSWAADNSAESGPSGSTLSTSSRVVGLSLWEAPANGGGAIELLILEREIIFRGSRKPICTSASIRGQD
jgi:hypothetical protein